MRITILKKHWKLRFTTLKNNNGECDAPTLPGKEIRVKRGLSEKKELEILIHEMLHAADWYKDEEWVHAVAHDIARTLWNLGWRKNDQQ